MNMVCDKKTDAFFKGSKMNLADLHRSREIVLEKINQLNNNNNNCYEGNNKIKATAKVR